MKVNWKDLFDYAGKMYDKYQPLNIRMTAKFDMRQGRYRDKLDLVLDQLFVFTTIAREDEDLTALRDQLLVQLNILCQLYDVEVAQYSLDAVEDFLAGDIHEEVWPVVQKATESVSKEKLSETMDWEEFKLPQGFEIEFNTDVLEDIQERGILPLIQSWLKELEKQNE